MQAGLGQAQHMQEGVVWLLASTKPGWADHMIGYCTTMKLLSREATTNVWLLAPYKSTDTSTQNWWGYHPTRHKQPQP
jgi:hypothetical protein